MRLMAKRPSNSQWSVEAVNREFYKMKVVANSPPLQMSRDEGWSIVGTDVEALFPSLADLESAKIVREAVRDSEMSFNNVDYNHGLVYLRIMGGADYLKGTLLRNKVPTWKGKRPDLVSVGGELSYNLDNWVIPKRELLNCENEKL